jgi:di/tricarboxylate transporter
VTAFPALPNEHALAALILLAIALYLFARDDLPLEYSSIGILAALAVGFALFPLSIDGEPMNPARFFEGFGHEALIAVCALMVVGQGLVRTAALEPLGRFLATPWSRVPFLAFFVTLAMAALLSAFVNNTPIVVLLLPILVGVCLRTGTSAAGLLMPMGFATIIGGMTTTIGTSTNLLVVSVAHDLGMARLGMFDFAVPAMAAGVIGIVYLWLIAPRLLPERELELADASPRLFEARLELRDDSPAVGQTLAEAAALTNGDMKVVRIRRGDTFLYPLPDVKLRAGDRLRINDTPAQLKRFETALKATLYSSDRIVDAENPLRAEGQTLAEIAVVQGSALDRTSLRYAQFLHRYQLAVVALHRAGREILPPTEEINDVLLAPGDVLLVQGSQEHIRELKRSTDFLVLDGSMELPHTAKASLARAILVGVVVVAALGILPISVSAVTGAALMVFTRCMDLTTALRAITPSVFFVIVASLALGRALVDTGATQYITEVFLVLMHGAPPAVVLSGLMALLALLTNVVTNNAAAVIGTPIAISIANQLALPVEPFVLAVLFGANMSFCTPMAYQTNLLIMAGGNYRFAEFAKVGIPLTLIMLIALTWLLSTLYF